MGEMVFPPNQDSGDHRHDAIEMFYVESGELEHVVNGVSQILKPGMAGFVAARHRPAQDRTGRGADRGRLGARRRGEEDRIAMETRAVAAHCRWLPGGGASSRRRGAGRDKIEI